MKRNILKFICGIGLVCGLWSCESGNQSFPDYEGGTTVYFPYQYPVRTIVLGDDEYDLTLDHAHKCQIKATFGGSYNGSNGTVQVAVDESLVNNLTFEDGTPVKAMPSGYYTLSTTNLAFGGTMNGVTEVQLTDAFFADPDAVKNTYVIPLVITGQSGFGKILTGTLLDESNPGPRCDAELWDVKPMDYVLYCVKFQNKYSGWWLSNRSTSTANIEKAQSYEIRSKSMNSCLYSVSYQGKWWQTNKETQELEEVDSIFKADIQLNFDASEKCTITSPSSAYTATGTGSWGDNTEIKAWGNKDRDGMELNYTVDFGADEKGLPHQFSTHEKMVWQRSGVKVEEFVPAYVK